MAVLLATLAVVTNLTATLPTVVVEATRIGRTPMELPQSVGGADMGGRRAEGVV